MKYRVLITRRAEQQIDAADRWWVENRAGAPDAIRDALSLLIDRLATLPLSGSLVPTARHAATRRILLADVGYHVYYRVRGDRVEILRFWHAARGTSPRV